LSLGGDGHFLSIAQYIKNDNLPMIGVNSDPVRSNGFLCDFNIYPNSTQNHMDQLMLRLINIDKAEFKYRSRLSVDVERHVVDENTKDTELQKITNKLCLNEIVLEESHGAKTCTYVRFYCFMIFRISQLMH
jgi:NAD kinase